MLGIYIYSYPLGVKWRSSYISAYLLVISLNHSEKSMPKLCMLRYALCKFITYMNQIICHLVKSILLSICDCWCSAVPYFCVNSYFAPRSSRPMYYNSSFCDIKCFDDFIIPNYPTNLFRIFGPTKHSQTNSIYGTNFIQTVSIH
jgi:hypothetical protein